MHLHTAHVCAYMCTHICVRAHGNTTLACLHVLARHRHSVVLVPGRTDHACAGTHPLPNTLLFGSHALLGAGGDTVHRTDQAQVLGNTQPRRYKLLSSLMDLEHRHRSGQPSRYNTAGPQAGRGLPAPLPRVAPRPSEPGQHGAELHEVPSLDESGVPGPTTRRADQADTAVWTHGLRVAQASPRKTESGSNRNTSPPCGGSCTVLRPPPPPRVSSDPSPPSRKAGLGSRSVWPVPTGDKYVGSFSSMPASPHCPPFRRGSQADM